MLASQVMNTPGIWESFVAGILTFLSPCLLPLVPIYILYLQGGISNDKKALEEMSEDEKALEEKRIFRRGLIRTFGFIFGFTLVFVLLGFAASSVGSFLMKYRKVIARVAGAIIIFFGLSMLGVIRINALTKDYRKMNGASSIGMGVAFALGWTPCISPILGTVLMMTAAVSDQMWQGVLLLLVYSLGLAIPFLMVYLFLGFFEKHAGGFTKHAPLISKIGGVVIVLFGVLLLFDKVGWLIGLFA